MQPAVLKVFQENPHPRHIRVAADALGKGEIVLCPTETGYCFVGDAGLDSSHREFLRLRKAHPTRKPFSLLCRNISQMAAFCQLSTAVYRIAAKALPGPYTFILEINRHTPKIASDKRKSVGIRISSNPIAQALVECFGKPLLITSVTDAEELSLEDYFEGDEAPAWWSEASSICEHFGGGFSVALANNEAVPMRVSTVIDFSVEPAILVRDGGWGNDIIGLIQL